MEDDELLKKIDFSKFIFTDNENIKGFGGGIIEWFLNKDEMLTGGAWHPSQEQHLRFFNEFLWPKIELDIKEYKNKIEMELAHTREDIIKTVINHVVKKLPINKEELFKHTMEMIKVFTVERTTFDRVIDVMIKNDYIEEISTKSGHIISKLLY